MWNIQKALKSLLMGMLKKLKQINTFIHFSQDTKKENCKKKVGKKFILNSDVGVMITHHQEAL